MLRIINRAKKVLGRVHRNEDGMEALQVVLIIALGRIILAFAYKMLGGESGQRDRHRRRQQRQRRSGSAKSWTTLFNWK